MSNQYRKKPVVVEAFQMTEARRMDNSEWPQWLHEAWNKPEGEPGALFRQNMDAPLPDLLCIQTLEGVHLVMFGDWIIRGVAGELYPCKPDIFAATYEPVALTQALATPEPVLTALKPEDVDVEVLTKQLGGFAHMMYSGVRLTHRPSGVSVTVDSERSQHKNRHLAWEKLAALVAKTGPVPASPADMQVYDKIAAGYWTERKGEPPEGEFFAFDPDGGNAFYKTRQEAINHAKESLKYYRDGANDHGEWDEDVEYVRWGVVMQRAKATNVSATEDGESSCDYELQDVATRPAPGGPEDFALVQQATERKGEPVYMAVSAFIDGKPYNWREVSKDFYDTQEDRYRRVLYTSPQVPEDTARLDWIEQQHLEELTMGIAIDCEHDGQYYVCGDSNKTGYGDTLREALDAARKGE